MRLEATNFLYLSRYKTSKAAVIWLKEVSYKLNYSTQEDLQYSFKIAELHCGKPSSP